MIVRSCRPCIGAFDRQRSREAQPFLAVVVAIREEVLADEHLELRAEPARRRDEHDEQHRGEQQLRSAAHGPSRRRSNGRSIRRRRRRAGTRPKSASAVEWNTAPRDRCRSTVQPVLRAVATARNGMTITFARPRDDPDVGIELPEQHAHRRRRTVRARICPRAPRQAA